MQKFGRTAAIGALFWLVACGRTGTDDGLERAARGDGGSPLATAGGSSNGPRHDVRGGSVGAAAPESSGGDALGGANNVGGVGGTYSSIAGSTETATANAPEKPTELETAPRALRPSEALTTLCDRLVGGVTFFDCTSPPRTRDYPDCRTIIVSTESRACPPAKATVNIIGYPGIARTIDAAVQTVPGHAEALQLLSRVGRAGAKPAALLGTLESTSKQPTTIETLLRMAVGPELRQYTQKPFILEQTEEPKGTTRDGRPIPIGNGRFVRGL